MLILSVEVRVRAKITAVWRSPPPHSGVCINADEILLDAGQTA